jgi:adenylate cyclase
VSPGSPLTSDGVVDAARGERRLVTALFADLSGFSTLSDLVEDPEVLHDLVSPLIEGLAEVAERNGGLVAKFAGDALLITFGATAAREDDAARAAHTAVEMHDRFAQMLAGLPPAGVDLGLRIGVETGHAISARYGGPHGELSVLGDAIVVAQRLQAAADVGSTLVGPAARAAIGEHFALTPVGELAVKGRARPVPAWRLEGPLVGGPGQAATRLAGRAAERAVLGRLLEEVRGGGGGAACVLGEAGSGKTALLDDLCAAAAASGVQVRRCRCLSFGMGLAYEPWARMLRGVTGLEPGAGSGAAVHRAVALLGPHAPALLELAGVDVRRHGLPPLPPGEAGRAVVHRAVRGWVRSWAPAPALLVVDDLHWADEGTTALLAEVAEQTAEQPLLVVWASRVEQHVAPAVDVVAVHLATLDEPAVGQLVAGLLGGPATPDLVRAVHARSGGNPLFARELVRSLDERGGLVRHHAAWDLGAGGVDVLPTSVERVIGDRLDRLAPGPRGTLAAASVIGRDVRLPLLRAVARHDDVDAHVEVLAGAGFLVTVPDAAEPTLRFSHALVQDVAYGRLLRRHRVELHAQIARAAAEAYGGGDDVIELLARHAGLGRTSDAPALLRRAAARARSLHALDQAEAHLRLADDLSPGDPELRTELADVVALQGRFAAALELYGTVESTASAAGTADVLRRLGRFREALAVAEAASAADPLDPALQRVRAHVLVALRRYEEAVAVLGRVPDARWAASGQTLARDRVLAAAHLNAGRTDAALAAATAALDGATASGDPLARCAALRMLGDVHSKRGEHDRGRDALLEGLRTAEEIRAQEEVGGVLVNLGQLEEHRGRLADAVAWSVRAAEVFEAADHPLGVLVATSNVAELLRALGDLAGARRWAERALALPGQDDSTAIARTMREVVAEADRAGVPPG